MENGKNGGKFHYAWVVLAALCVVRSLSAAGINNTGGLFLTPVSSELGVGVGTLSVYFSISAISAMLAMPIAGKLIQKVSLKLLVAAAVILQAGSFAALGFMRNVWGWYILAVPLGIGGAVTVNLAGPIFINRWFANNTGAVLGVLMACSGIFGAFIQPLMLRLISDIGWRRTYTLTGAVIAAAALILTLFLLSDSPQKKNTEPLSLKNGKAAKAPPDRESGTAAKDALKKPAFYFLFVLLVSLTAAGAFTQHLTPYGTALGYGSGRMGLVLSAGMAGSTAGAFFIGFLSDRTGVFRAAFTVIGCAAAAVGCLALGGVSFLAFAAGSFLLGLCSMGLPVLAPLLTVTFFGGRDYETIYSNVMMGPPFASVVLLPVYGFLFDLRGDYRLVLVIMGVFVAVGAVCIAAGRKAAKEKK